MLTFSFGPSASPFGADGGFAPTPSYPTTSTPPPPPAIKALTAWVGPQLVMTQGSKPPTATYPPLPQPNSTPTPGPTASPTQQPPTGTEVPAYQQPLAPTAGGSTSSGGYQPSSGGYPTSSGGSYQPTPDLPVPTGTVLPGVEAVRKAPTWAKWATAAVAVAVVGGVVGIIIAR